MALFTTPPNRKLAYHLDGSVVSWNFNGGAFTTLNQTQLNYFNDEDFVYDGVQICSNTSVGTTFQAIITILLPVLYDIDRYFIYTPTSCNNAGLITECASLSSVLVSTDTTTGIDGTWTTLSNPSPTGVFSKHTTSYNLSSTEWFDDSYISGTLTGTTAIKGIRFVLNLYTGGGYAGSIRYFNVNTLNLWGKINDSSATQRVAWTDNTGTALTTDKLYTTHRSGADIIGGQYLKNLHTNATNQIVFSIDGEQSTVTSNITISVDGGTTFNTLPYTWTTSLASGTVSNEIQVKYTVPSDMAYGYKYYGITVTPTFV